MTVRPVATGPMREQAASSMRRLAASAETTHTGMAVHQHIRDAAKQLDISNTKGATRHLNAAMHELTPQQLTRHGVSDDAGHVAAKRTMGQAHRHLLMVKDIEDAQERNDQIRQQAIEKMEQASQAKVAAQQQKAAAQAAKAPVTAAQLAQVMGIAIELSAKTGELSITPHPFGKPSGPGLWGVKDMQLPPYIQNIARALLRTGRAKNLSQAIAIAKGAVERWKNGKNTSPEVRAASAATDADWEAKRARAHSDHSGGSVGSVIELFNPMQPRDAHGQWTHGGAVSAHLLKHTGGKGSTGHVAAIHRLADYYNPPGTLQIPGGHGAANEYLATSLHHAADALSKRQMGPLAAHLHSAARAARLINPQAQAHVESVRRSLTGVPAGVSNRSNPRPTQTTFNPSRNRSGLDFSTWNDVCGAIELAAVPEGGPGKTPPKSQAKSQNAEGEQRVPKGQLGGGQFTKGSGGQQGGKAKPGPVKHLTSAERARKKAALLATAREDRQKIHQLAAELKALMHSSKKSAAGKAKATKAGQTGKTTSSTPAKKTTPQKKGAAGTPQKTVSTASRISSLRKQIAQLRTAATMAAAQAAEL